MEDYHRWYHEQKDPESRQKACNAIVHEWLLAVAANSEFEIDEEERNEWCLKRARCMYNGMAAAGYDPRKQEDGTVLTEEAVIEQEKKIQREVFIPYLTYCHFCESNGFVVTKEEFLDDVRKAAAENGITEEEAMKRTEFTFYRQMKYQEHTFLHILGPEAEKYLED